MDLESAYSSFQSANVFVEIFRELMPLVIAITLLYLYYRGRITIIDTLLYAFASEAYTMLAIGPTFTASFFIQMFFLVDQVHRLITGRLFIKKEYLLLLMMPLLSQVAVFLIIQLYKDPFSYPQGKMFTFYTKPLYFYIKTYLPLMALGARIIQDREFISFNGFYATMKRITLIACCIAVLQILVIRIFNSIELGEVFGLQRRYLIEGVSNGILGMRVQALFSEPKTFSAFLSLSIPILIKDREYKSALFAFLIAFSTSSQTFWVNMMIAGLLFVFLKNMPSVRTKILGTLGVVIGVFLIVAASKDFFLKHYMENRNDPLYKTLFERSAYRYDNEIWQKDNIVLGIPLQRDMELPIVDFFRSEPYLLISGYGPGNSVFIPETYFFGQYTSKAWASGIGGHNINMRWFYILAEFGAIALCFFFIIMTKTNQRNTSFNNHYLAYVAICFFFCQIDLFLIIVALLSVYGNNDPEEDDAEEEVAPRLRGL
ncbi:hypothetical protein ECE50_000840 [Chitinophaga sp. Mgbs1]|uniref:Uncharacterized protein n=1 Tax=Chitinophaga solisilvae TaxID=1233460 RepID=A0A433WNU1_9BACT|nr:hypothetical protein [Chitinophaga solisilvae]